MDYILRDFKSTSKFSEISKNEKRPLAISGLVFAGKSLFVSSLINENKKKNVLLVTYNELQAKNLVKDLEYFNEEVFFFPKREIAIYDYDAESNDIEYQRIDILNKVHSNKAKIVVTTAESLMQSMPKKEDLFKNVIKIKQGQDIDIEDLKYRLLKMGYERQDLTENRSEFSVRGDIIDIGTSDEEGIRIELWGDTVDSIRRFRLASQRSVETIEKVEICPATELVLVDSFSDIAARIEDVEGHIKDDSDLIREGIYTNKIDKYFNEFYQEQSNLLDYFEDYEIIFDEKDRVENRIKAIKEDTANLITEFKEKDKYVAEALVNVSEFKLDFRKVKNIITLTEEDKKENHFNFREVNFLNGEAKIFQDSVKKASKNNKKIVILAGSKDNREKIYKLLEGSVKADDLNNINIKEGQVIVSCGALSSGFENKDTGLIVVSSDEFFVKPIRRKKRVNDAFSNSEKIVFADLKVGDLIVHRNYGIGVFDGVKTITTDNITKDYISLRYRGGDGLYVPTDSLDNVRKYIGGEQEIKLNKLGTKEWDNTKAKVKSNLRLVAKELIELYAKREKARGYAFSKDTVWQNQFEEDFSYKETDDQERCIEEVKKDMESERPMDRLLCGDVGYGKTEVAIRAAFKAVMDGKQVCYLAPTTILANQQYEEFKSRMENYPITCDLLNRFRTAKEQRETVKKIKQGKVDIVIGTHRVLSKDVEFKNLGLLIIDEEHRFGVKAKEKIKEYKTNVDVLTMTATPIPRTLQMSIVGIRDMSVIYNPPHDRKPVQTYVLEYDTEIIKEAITKELERNGQVFYLYNTVEDIALKAEEIEKLVPEANVAYAHGKMRGEDIENIMEDFINKKTNVLVCTTILESGIDIPNANTIIVENADRLGLAQLYQIRGRVGRASRQAYAYITYRKNRMISEDATQRLKAIKEFTEFGSGFKIATRDLQIRGAGSIFGEMQHGHMEQVGYDMYNELLNEVVKEEKGIEVKKEVDVQIDINVSAYIPDDYIENSSQKIEVYQDIANARTEEDIKEVIDEIVDRYGSMPEEVSRLIEVARIKNIARNKNIEKIQKRPMGVVFTFVNDNVNIDDDKALDLLKNYGHDIHFSGIGKPYITLNVDDNDIEKIKSFLEEL